jgi:hypothetical protein
MTVVSSLHYTAPLELYRVEKPFYSNVPAPDGRQSNQVAWAYSDIEFGDIRGILDEFELDVHGFEVFTFGDSADDETHKFDTDAQIEEDYYPVVEHLLKARFGDIKVVIFDHTVRRRKTAAQLEDFGDNIRATRQPSLSAHCGTSSPVRAFVRCAKRPLSVRGADQTILSGENRVKLHMGSAATDLLKSRCRIIK